MPLQGLQVQFSRSIANKLKHFTFLRPFAKNSAHSTEYHVIFGRKQLILEIVIIPQSPSKYILLFYWEVWYFFLLPQMNYRPILVVLFPPTIELSCARCYRTALIPPRPRRAGKRSIIRDWGWNKKVGLIHRNI